MKKIRQLHLYLGTFFAPAIIFFALTGALQTFGLHETPRGSTTPRPAWIAELAEVHIHQRLEQPHKGSPPGAPNTTPGAPGKASATTGQATASEKAGPDAPPNRDGMPPGGPPKPAHSTLPLKIFILFMAVGLISTTLLGIYMAFKYNRDRRVIWGLLLAGIILPILLLSI